jgi:hypothetical protein
VMNGSTSGCCWSNALRRGGFLEAIVTFIEF